MLGFSVSIAVRAVICGNCREEAVECLPNGWVAAWDLEQARQEERPSLLCCPAGVRLSGPWSRACGVGSLVTAWINFGLSMNLLSLSQGVVLKMGVPLQASAGVGAPGAPQNSACGWKDLAFTIRRLSALQPSCGISIIGCWLFSRF